MAKLDLSRIRFGATAWAYYDPNPSDMKAFREAVEDVRKLPFPDKDGEERYVEVLAVLPDKKYCEALVANTGEMKLIADDNNQRIILTGFIPNIEGAASIYSLDKNEQREGVELIKRGIDLAYPFEKDKYSVLGGPTQGVHEKFPEGMYTSRQIRDMEDYFVDNVTEHIVPYATKAGTRVNFECLNVDEMVPILEPGDIALELIERIDSEFAKLHTDTIHYAQDAQGNYTDSITEVVRKRKTSLLHLCEHNRKQFGKGDIGYRVLELFEKVAPTVPEGSVLYAGLENFSKGLHRTLKIWRPDYNNSREVVRAGASYLQEKLSA